MNSDGVMVILALLAGLTLVVLLIVYAAGGLKSGMAMNSDQNLFMQLHSNPLTSSTPAYGRR